VPAVTELDPITRRRIDDLTTELVEEHGVLGGLGIEIEESARRTADGRRPRAARGTDRTAPGVHRRCAGTPGTRLDPPVPSPFAGRP
jgi:hypothetical protein